MNFVAMMQPELLMKKEEIQHGCASGIELVQHEM
jgi:hypothetical protein